MNLEAIYGDNAANLPTRGASTLTALSLLAVPPAVSPLDTVTAIQKGHQKNGDFFAGPIMGLLVVLFAVWVVIQWR